MLATPMAEKLMETDLDFKGNIPIPTIYILIFSFDEWNGLVRGFCIQNVAETDVLKTFFLPYVVVIWNVDT